MPDMIDAVDTVDAIVVGSGAGGAAAAYRLVRRGLSVLMLEKGGHLPRDGSTLSTRDVFKLGKFKSKEPWHDGKGQGFVPSEFYNIGGKTKWYGAALLRFSPHEFRADPAHRCLPWPFGHEELAPYYDEAERLLPVNRFDNEPELQRLVDRICRQDPSWRSEPLPLGLKREILANEEEAKHFDGFASVAGFKADAERNLIERVVDAPNFRLLTKKKVVGLLHAEGEPERVEGVVCLDGSYFRARHVVLAAGAMTSPRILQDHMNDSHPHTTVQCLGWLDGDLLATQLPAAVPKFLTDAAGAHAYGFFVTTEDGSSPANRVVTGFGDTPTLDYDLARLPESRTEH